ncbi:cellulase family protein [Cordyceps militaris CM01]|uniref:Cellulase family protein n=1 Tax=Cordyceps militaris (strain CM01) TaxID=983644 RepID=G3JNB7_CORMM|nr:cellulase family protein [Cordyceps militaris CM01]EGX90299.1 cellulase family protein [Cordyceps militaris CM01]
MGSARACASLHSEEFHSCLVFIQQGYNSMEAFTIKSSSSSAKVSATQRGIDGWSMDSSKPTTGIRTTTTTPSRLCRAQHEDQSYYLQTAQLLGMKLSTVLALAGLAMSSLTAGKPKVPLHTSSRWILGSDNQRVKLRCVNWAGHLEANVPEGLHKQPVAAIAGWIAAHGFNCVRLTYSIDMALHPDLPVAQSFRAAAVATGADEAGLMALHDAAVCTNPFLHNATVLEAFDAVQAALWDYGIMTILDNHVSRASWCCNLDDGNGWWSDAPGDVDANSRFFDHGRWLDGLRAMAAWARGKPGIIGMSLRNELRAHVTQIPAAAGVWRENMPAAAKAVHGANPDVLVIMGGLNGGTDLTPLRDRSRDTSAWAGKNVWEAHAYSFTITTPDFGSCSIRKVNYGLLFGFVLEQNKGNTGPLFLSEFGVGMTGGDKDGLNDKDSSYLTCLREYMEDNDADWSLWALQGTYYVRDGKVDAEETWGALDHDWKDWRNPKFKAMLGKMPEVTQFPRG